MENNSVNTNETPLNQLDQENQEIQEQETDAKGSNALQHNTRKLIGIAAAVLFVIILAIIIGVTASSGSDSSPATNSSESKQDGVPSGSNPTNSPQNPCPPRGSEPVGTASPTGIPALRAYGFYAAPYPSNSGLNGYGANYDESQRLDSTRGWCKEGAAQEYFRNGFYFTTGSGVQSVELRLYTCNNEDDYGSRWAKYGENKPTFNVYGGMFTRCRAKDFGVQPSGGWPTQSAATCLGSSLDNRQGLSGVCVCPDGFTEFVVSEGMTSDNDRCPITEYKSDGRTSVVSYRSTAEVVLCYNKDQWRHGESWFGGMFSEPGSAITRSADPQSRDGIISFGDKTFGNPLNNELYECPCGYEKTLIGLYCASKACKQGEIVNHYVCLKE